MKKLNLFIIALVLVNLSTKSSLAQKIDVSSIKKAVSTTTKSSSSSVSKDEAAKGMKSALTVGATNASTKLNKTDGFFKDAAIKILMPPEAQKITKNISLIPGGKKLSDDFILRMNRAAEDAAITAKPIFINVITSMTIADAWSILTGGDNAATNYLRKTSYKPLQAAFQPKIDESLRKNLVGNISAATAWSNLMTANNKAAKSMAGKAVGMQPVNTNLAQYVTERALNGLFIKIAEEEKLIRKNPVARVNDILKKVFGELDKK